MKYIVYNLSLNLIYTTKSYLFLIRNIYDLNIFPLNQFGISISGCFSQEELCDAINKKYSDFLPSLQSSEELTVQVEEISKEMDSLKNRIENEVSVWNEAWLKSCRLKSWSDLAFAHLGAGAAEYSRGCDGLCKAEAAAGEKQCRHKGARPSKRGTTQVVM